MYPTMIHINAQNGRYVYDVNVKDAAFHFTLAGAFFWESRAWAPPNGKIWKLAVCLK